MTDVSQTVAVLSQDLTSYYKFFKPAQGGKFYTNNFYLNYDIRLVFGYQRSVDIPDDRGLLFVNITKDITYSYFSLKDTNSNNIQFVDYTYYNSFAYIYFVIAKMNVNNTMQNVYI